MLIRVSVLVKRDFIPVFHRPRPRTEVLPVNVVVAQRPIRVDMLITSSNYVAITVDVAVRHPRTYRVSIVFVSTPRHPRHYHHREQKQSDPFHGAAPLHTLDDTVNAKNRSRKLGTIQSSLDAGRIVTYYSVMPKRSSTRKIADINLLAASIVTRATEELAPAPKPEKNPAAVALGRLGGLKGGKARAEKLSDERRKEIATKAASARWGIRS